eukprot:scaffold165182_cov45-Attheya_sp.AAC.1
MEEEKRECEFPRCSNGAFFGFPDEPGISRLCETHKEPDMVLAQLCQFPRCTNPALYSFADEPTLARFCDNHKSDDMVVTITSSSSSSDEVPPPAPTPVSVDTKSKKKQPSEASLELAYEYFEMKPEFESLDHIEKESSDHQKKLDNLRSVVRRDVSDIHKISKGIDKLEIDLKSQEGKLINLGTRSPLGMGILMKDNDKVEKWQKEKQEKTEVVQVLEGQKKDHESTLEQVSQEQERLNGLVETRKALEARIQELRSACLEEEASGDLRRLQSRVVDHERMNVSLHQCLVDVRHAHAMFSKALHMQAQAARSNAVAGGANIGQIATRNGGRGIGESPGERLMQIRRNKKTKESILIAKDACDRLNTAQHRLPNEIRVAYPDEMNGVGNVEIPDLWHGSFFRDFLAGQAGGNVGDAINQVRAMRKIRKNMQELEKIIAVCNSQETKMDSVEKKISFACGVLREEVHTQEKELLEYVIAVATAQKSETEKK